MVTLPHSVSVQPHRVHCSHISLSLAVRTGSYTISSRVQAVFALALLMPRCRWNHITAESTI